MATTRPPIYGPMLRHSNLLISCCAGDEGAAARSASGVKRNTATIRAGRKRFIRAIIALDGSKTLRARWGLRSSKVAASPCRNGAHGGHHRRDDAGATFEDEGVLGRLASARTAVGRARCKGDHLGAWPPELRAS